LLVTEEVDNPTETISLEELEEAAHDEIEALGIEGPALVVRSGGGRAGEQFTLERTQTTVGRSPDCDIFLDDVTVSRRHAIVARGAAGFTLEDLGSLNGTFLNRHRIEKADLETGDEVQIGKYRLIYLNR
jgi:pSer/pThr/pTyr-binding forkhead associated (FHA) protein